jgi:ADP-ribose pyrophosphatase YjhB (NUDIX family)
VCRYDRAVNPAGFGTPLDPTRWVEWARELVTMAQTGLTYARDPYDVGRYTRVREIALAMLATGANAPLATVRAIFDGEVGHATPKVDVRAAVFHEGDILLVRERRDGRWTLPGGWADVGETPREAIEREVYEESGYRVRATRLLAVYDKRAHAHPPQPFYVYKLFFGCEIVSGTARASDETDHAAFFAPDDLPELSRDRVTPAQIARMFAVAGDPSAPTDFD